MILVCFKDDEKSDRFVNYGKRRSPQTVLAEVAYLIDFLQK
ncbi:MAG: hypothetical protein SXA11_02450 [Cyanobacteriota bacterium]|nr:hypothetical protein [Cyanobacteriota bacterium]